MKLNKYISAFTGLILLFSCQQYEHDGWFTGNVTGGVVYTNGQAYNEQTCIVPAYNNQLTYAQSLVKSSELDQDMVQQKAFVETQKMEVKDFNLTSCTAETLVLKDMTYFYSNINFDPTTYIDYFEICVISPSTGYRSIITKTWDISRYETDQFNPQYKTWHLTIDNKDFKSFRNIANDVQMQLIIHYKKVCPFKTYFHFSGGLETQYRYKYKN